MDDQNGCWLIAVSDSTMNHSNFAIVCIISSEQGEVGTDLQIRASNSN